MEELVCVISCIKEIRIFAHLAKIPHRGFGERCLMHSVQARMHQVVVLGVIANEVIMPTRPDERIGIHQEFTRLCFHLLEQYSTPDSSAGMPEIFIS